jgi:hypothetical protein
MSLRPTRRHAPQPYYTANAAFAPRLAIRRILAPQKLSRPLSGHGYNQLSFDQPISDVEFSAELV